MGSFRQSLMGAAVSYPEWIVKVSKEYGIPIANLVKAQNEFGDSVKAFFFEELGTPWITNPNRAVINTGFVCEKGDIFEIRFKENIQPRDKELDRSLWGWRWGTHTSKQELYAYQYFYDSYVCGGDVFLPIRSNTDTLFIADTKKGISRIYGIDRVANYSLAFSGNSAISPFCLFGLGTISLSQKILGDEFSSINKLIIKRNGDIKVFMIPVWNKERVGMYDLARGQFFNSYNDRLFTYTLEQ